MSFSAAFHLLQLKQSVATARHPLTDEWASYKSTASKINLDITQYN